MQDLPILDLVLLHSEPHHTSLTAKIWILGRMTVSFSSVLLLLYVSLQLSFRVLCCLLTSSPLELQVCISAHTTKLRAYGQAHSS